MMKIGPSIILPHQSQVYITIYIEYMDLWSWAYKKVFLHYYLT